MDEISDRSVSCKEKTVFLESRIKKLIENRNSLKKVIQSTTDSFREKGSKFIGYLFTIETKEAFEEKLAELKSKYPDATHHCYAWRLNPSKLEEFAQDDGEPSGTAGLPILNQLKSFEVVNAGLVVVRYYGGTNLGKPGLIEAYGRSAQFCLQKAQLKPIQLIWRVEITYPYSEQKTIDKLMHQFDLKELESEYKESVRLILACPIQHNASLAKNLEQLEHLGVTGSFLEKSFL